MGGNRFFILAGEASGDLHGAHLIRALKSLSSNASFSGFGGDKMAEAGFVPILHCNELAFMGFFDVIRNLGKVKKYLALAKNSIKSFNPDVVILIDYPGFNLKIAKYAHDSGYKVVYFIPPKVWASRAKRALKIKASCDAVISILPFEIDFLAKYGINAFYAGNPLTEAIAGFNKTQNKKEFLAATALQGKPIIALLAGSRVGEVKHILPVMVEAASAYPDFQFVVAGVSSLGSGIYESYLKNSNVRVIYDNTYALVSCAEAALVASGTATLETALLGTPQVVCYALSGGSFVYYLFRAFMRVNYISLVNLILDKPVVEELIQQYYHKASVIAALNKILYDKKYCDVMLGNYKTLQSIVETEDIPSKMAASEIMRIIKPQKESL